MSEKEQLRQAFLDRLQAVEPAAAAAASAKVCQRLTDLDPVRAAAHIAVFAVIPGEIDLAAFVDASLAANKTIYYPRYRRQDKVYEMAAIAARQRDLVPGAMGILEPLPELPSIDQAVRQDALLWLTPGIAFDLGGGRLGRGGGFYDRLLAGCRGTKVGIVFDWQVTPAVPVDEYDVSMDWIVSDKRCASCGG